MSLSPPGTSSSLAARRGRAAPPLSVAAKKDSPKPTFEFDDSLLQVSTPAFPMGIPSPGHPPKIAASPRAPPPPAQPSRPALRQARSFTNSKPTHKSSFLDLFSSSRSKSSSSKKDPDPAPPRKSLGSRPKPPAMDDLPALPLHLQPTFPTNRKTTESPSQVEIPTVEVAPPEPAVNGVKSASGKNLVAALQEMEPAAPPPQKAPTEWTPPTLALAYPQAIVHSALEDPDSYRASSRLRPTTPSARATPSRPSTGHRKPRGGQRRPSDMGGDVLMDDATTADGIPRKIYVLVSAGYVLEYAGSGPRDRLPERSLKLGPSSAAFASDAIPGKHWVVHVVQNASDTTADQPLAPKKSFVQRVFKSNPTNKKKTTRRLLLIFEGPALMNQWMIAVRNEIGRMNGKKPERPATAIKQIDDDDSKTEPELVISQSPAEEPLKGSSDFVENTTSNPAPSSAVKPASGSPPTATTALPSSPTTLVGSERLSRADTAVASGMSSSRSSRAVGKAPLESMRNAVNPTSPIPERRSNEISAASQDGEPPLTDEDRELESATTHSHASLSFDSSVGASQTSTEKTTPLDTEPSSDIGSALSSPGSTFFTPLTTPATWTFPKDAKRVSTYASATTSPISQSQEEPLVSPAVLSARSSAHGLRQSASAPRLAVNTPPAMETIRESSTYFSRRNPDPLQEEDEEPPRSPMGNAFAQAAERRERSHSRELSSSTTPSASNNSSTRTSVAAMRTSPRGTPLQSQPGSKRTSVIHANGPLPLRTSQTYDSLSIRAAQDIESGYGVDLRNVQTKGEHDTRESVLLQLSGTGEPALNGRLGGDATLARLRRPNSLRVKTDVRSFGTAGPRDVQSPPAGQGQVPTAPASATEKTRSPPHSGRSSTLVPVVRPPSVRPNNMRTSRQMRMGMAAGPPSAPPNVPLPLPPTSARTPLSS